MVQRVVRPQAAPAAPPIKKPVAPMDPKIFQRNKRSVFLIMLGIPLFTVSSYVLYKRVILGEQKRVQQGEYTPDGGLRFFEKEEKEARDRNSWSTYIFGKEK